MSRLSCLLSRRTFFSSIIRERVSASACSPSLSPSLSVSVSVRVNQVRTKITGAGTLESPFPSVAIPEITLPEYIWKNVDKWEDKPCVTCGVSDRSYSYGETRAYSQRFAFACLGQLGLTKGDVIGLILPNIPEYVLAIFGGIEAGLVVTFANPLYTPDEILRQFVNANVRAVVTVQALLPAALEVGKGLKDYRGTIVIGLDEHDSSKNTLSFKQLLMEAEPKDLPKLKPSEIALLPYSSGTTGLPKGVMLSHENLVGNLTQLMHPQFVDYIPTSEDYQETALSVLPFFHIYGFNGILNTCLVHGLRIISIPRFTPEDYIATVLKYKAPSPSSGVYKETEPLNEKCNVLYKGINLLPTVLFVVPSLLLFLASHPAVTKAHLESITKVVCGAAPATKSLLDKFIEKVGRKDVSIRQGYGMTESSPVTLFPPVKIIKAKSASCGQLIPNTEGVIKDLTTGQNLGPHESGELWVRGPQVMVGYLKNEAATKETVDADGWLHTGDVAYFDEDEYFFIVDRTKELIKVKGNQVSPSELENLIIQYPGVADVAVVGIPDILSGEVPRAFVVLKEKAKVKEQEIIDFVSPKVTKYKRLAGGVGFLDVIPRNPAGKVLRQQLKVLGNCK